MPSSDPAPARAVVRVDLPGRLLGGGVPASADLRRFPWNPSAPPEPASVLIQPASLLGMHGLSSLMVFAVLGLVVLIKERRLRFAWAASLPLRPLGRYLPSTWRIAGRCAVAVVQLDLDERKRYFEGDDMEGLHQAVQYTETALRQRPDLVLWPESVFIHGWEEGRAGRRGHPPFSKGPAPRQRQLVRRRQGLQFRSASSKGNDHGTVRQTALGPFGEYLPFRPLVEVLGLKVISRSISDFSAGPFRV